MQNMVILVEGMSCNHCKQAVEVAALTVKGVQKAEVVLAERTLTIEYEKEIFQKNELVEAIEDAGFEVPQP